MKAWAPGTWRHADGREQRGRVRVTTLGLDWQADGETTRQLDPRRLGSVDVDGEQLRVELRAREPGQPADELVIDDASLLAPLHELRASRARPVASAIQPADEGVATQSRPPVGLLLLLAGFALLFVGGWLLIGQLWRLVPEDVERLLGEASHAELVTDANRVEAPQLQAWLEDMLRELSDEGTDAPLQLDIIEAEDPNAFALPGGFIVVHTGLFRLAKRPEAVAGVLAHELVHVEQHHGLRQVMRSLGLWVGMSAVFGGGDLLVAGGSELIQLSHSRDAESEADALAAQKLQRAGRSVYGLIEFLRELEHAGSSLPDGLDWLSTHPSGSDRVERLEAVLADERFTPRPWLDDADAWQAAVERLLGNEQAEPLDEPR